MAHKARERKKLIKLRTSATILIPHAVLDSLGWTFDDLYTLKVEGDRVVVEKCEDFLATEQVVTSLTFPEKADIPTRGIRKK